MNPIPLGTRLEDVDPETREAHKPFFEQCRLKAHIQISAYIGEPRITVWKERSDDGKYERIGPLSAQKALGSNALGKCDNLYFDRGEWGALLSSIASDNSKRYMARIRASETANGVFYIPQPCADSQLMDWDDFPQSDRPKLERLRTELADDEYWTWPEALAWVGTRDLKRIAVIRHYGNKMRTLLPGEPDVAIGAQHYIARTYCASPADCESSLHRAAERGDVSTLARKGYGEPAGPLAKETWLGGKIICLRGVSALVSKADPDAAWAMDILVNREDLIRAFPAAPPGPSSQFLAIWSEEAKREFEVERDSVNGTFSKANHYQCAYHIKSLAEAAEKVVNALLSKASIIPDSDLNDLQSCAFSLLDAFGEDIRETAVGKNGRRPLPENSAFVDQAMKPVRESIAGKIETRRLLAKMAVPPGTGQEGLESLARAPSVRAGRPPSDVLMLAKADEMKARGLDGRTIAKNMRLEPGFENATNTLVRELTKGRWKGGRPSAKPA